MNPQPRIGLHTSIAGGLENALVEGRRLRADVVQLFVSSPTQWRTLPLDEAGLARFHATVEATGVEPVMVHGRYLTNLGSADRTIHRRSVETFNAELALTVRLGVPSLVIHPGSAKGARRESAIRRVADAVRAGIDATAGHPTRVLLETTAGAGNTLGGTFEELAELLSAIDRPERTGVCLDTCHVFVAGYDVKSAAGYERTFDRFEAVVGLDALFGFHANDSKGILGSRRDRHDQIGLGHIGARAFGRLLRDERFRHLPFVLETPKTRTPDGREYDAVNIAKLRRMAKNPVNLRNLR